MTGRSAAVKEIRHEFGVILLNRPSGLGKPGRKEGAGCSAIEKTTELEFLSGSTSRKRTGRSGGKLGKNGATKTERKAA